MTAAKRRDKKFSRRAKGQVLFARRTRIATRILERATCVRIRSRYTVVAAASTMQIPPNCRSQFADNAFTES